MIGKAGLPIGASLVRGVLAPRLAVASILSVAVGLFLYRVVQVRLAVDLGAIWTAGQMWNAGQSPYGPDFRAVGLGYFDPLLAPVFWVYPPQWWWISAPIATIPFGTALALWKILNAALFGAAVALLWASSRRLAVPTPLALRTVFVVAICTMEAVGANLFLGQTANLVLFGFALVLHGMATGSRTEQAIGHVILLLKPQFGLVFLALAFASRGFGKAVVVPVLVTGLACLPALTMNGVAGAPAVVGDLLGNIAAYGQHEFNRPDAMTGVSNLLAGASATRFPTLPLVFAAILVGWWLVTRLSRAGAALEAYWLASVTVLIGIVPLHHYELAFAAIPLLFIHRLRPLAAALAVVGLLLTYRTRWLADLLPTDDPLRVQLLLASIGAVSLLAAALVTARAGWRAAPHREQTAALQPSPAAR